MANADFHEIERKWLKKWEEAKIFESKDDSKKNKFYVLDMFPYPSGAGLHIGHAFVFSLGDIFARFKRMQGFNVLYPIGYDALGLPAENAAIKVGTHPEDYTKKSILNFMKQQKAMGWSYDWSRLIKTSDPEYYKWDQWIFLKMLEKGIAYRKKSAVNWCPKCQSVLANEQVIGGKCWRHEDTDVEIKHLEQWFFKITDYVEDLLKGLDKVDWPERAKLMQRNWIGRSEGTEIEFEIAGENKIFNVIIVHGSNSTEKHANEGLPENERHWKPWLKTELESRGIEVSNELYPQDWNPNYEEWKKVFEKNKINENTILVGHSAGGAFLVRWLSENKKKIKKLILVSPGKAGKESRKTLSDLYGNRTIKNIEEFVQDGISIFTSDDDIKHHIIGADEYGEELPAKVIRLGKGWGHFTFGDMGKKEFPELLNEILGNKKWPIFTTRPDTIFGVTFMVVSAQHPRLSELVTKEQKKEVDKFLKKLKSVSEKEMANLDKEGVFTGSYAINPMTKEKIPIWAGNFVVADYGSGMVMAVPAHDQRDFEFAEKYEIPMKIVIQPEKHLAPERMATAYTSSGKLINSENFDGLDNEEAKIHITKYLEEKKLGRKVVNYKLRDWLISRQRYWGTPIPVVYCDECGIVPVPEKDLPIKLPKEVVFGKGNPLVTNEKWVNTKCPKCEGKARRETDTMDTFVNSSWYYLRYSDPHNNDKIFDVKKANYWAPIDQYIGGPEHITMHLIYMRFYTKFLKDLGLLKFDEPALRYFTQGIVKAADGEKMSKSRENVVEPLSVIENYGADSLRLFLMSCASPDKDFNWDDKGMQGAHNFVSKVYNYFDNAKFTKASPKIESKINKTVKEVTDYVQDFKHNLAIIRIRALFDSFIDGEIDKKNAESFLKLLHIYCPFVTEELWEKIGGKGFISLADWPKVDESKINEKLEEEEKMIDGLVGDINNVLKIVGNKNKAFIYTLPNEKKIYSDAIQVIEKRTGLKIEIYSVSDKEKYDPEGKSKKAKPNRPSIYLE